MAQGEYKFQEIEKRWRTHWLKNQTFRTLGPGDPGFDPEKPKCYVLDMFPYPSGAGLHVGHPKGYIATDIYSRYKRMQGFNVLHPMGFDSFGLPAEQYAIEHNVHPAVVTEQNIDNMRAQLEFLGLSYSWDREIATSRPDYYRWTQWIFLQMFESWFDPEMVWKDASGRKVKGKARPVSDLLSEFTSGQRDLTDDDRGTAGVEMAGWNDLSEPQRMAILNNYRLAYEREVTVNWCPALGTVLSNEEVTNDGKSERGDHLVYKRPLKQWIMRITAYADRLLEDLDAQALPDGQGGTFTLDWPEAVALMQRNWIGRSEGARVFFDVLTPGTDVSASRLEVFTTRPDTLFGATFMVVAPQHPLVTEGADCFLVPDTWPEGTLDVWKGEDPSLDVRHALQAYVAQAEGRTLVREEEKEKTGVFTGIYALNPVNGAKLPIFVADYVSMDYGAGAIMAVPAHDERDFAFASRYGLDIAQVVEAPPGSEEKCFAGEGISIHSPTGGDGPFAITGLPTAEAKRKITRALEDAETGAFAVNYRLRDWIFSRQRYWGEPFPLATVPDGYSVPLNPPVELPKMEDFRPETSDDPAAPVRPPLGRADASWCKVNIRGMEAERELNVMPQWAGSCWYYLRFIDPMNDAAFCGSEGERYFMPVDLYIGGAEHAVLHLLYARFWHKALFDMGHVSTPEPFKKLFNQGMITADAFADDRGVYVDIREVEVRDGEPYHTQTGQKLQRFAGKMGKRYKNGLPPEEIGEEYGVDALRLYEMYMGPLDASAPWSMDGMRGMQRFLQRLWRNLVDEDGRAKVGGALTPELERQLHRTIQKVTDHVENLRFNTAIAALIELNNVLVPLDTIPEEIARTVVCLVAPFAPHMAEEIWRIAEFGEEEIASQPWPSANAELAKAETIVIPVQVNGKVRAKFDVDVDTDQAEVERLALEQSNVLAHLEGKTPLKVIVIPNRLVNIVV